MTLTMAQQLALDRGSQQWCGTRESGTMPNTMWALADRGLAEVRGTQRPYPRLAYRLTDAGFAEQARRKPLWKCSDEEVAERFTRGAITLDEHNAEMDRRGQVRRERGPELYAVAMRIDRGPHGRWEEFACAVDPEQLYELAEREAARFNTRATVVQWRADGRPTPKPTHIIEFDGNEARARVRA